MFALKVATLLVSTASVALAVPGIMYARNTCSTGPVSCCDSIQRADTPKHSAVLGTLSTDLSNPNVPLGVNCVPIPIMGAATAGTCSAQATCCKDFQEGPGGSLIGISCSPINLGL